VGFRPPHTQISNGSATAGSPTHCRYFRIVDGGRRRDDYCIVLPQAPQREVETRQHTNGRLWCAKSAYQGVDPMASGPRTLLSVYPTEDENTRQNVMYVLFCSRFVLLSLLLSCCLLHSSIFGPHSSSSAFTCTRQN
jgi:hypothetical protein